MRTLLSLNTTPKPWLPRLAFAPAQAAPRGDSLVVIFLRGGADGLAMIVPHGEEAYYALRPGLAIARPDDRRAKSDQRAIDLDGFFGLHPEMHPLLEMWQVKRLALIHACGAPDESRSHFKAMALIERGVDNERGPASGWIGRHLASLDTGNSSPLRAIGLGSMPQRSLSGSVPVTALRSIADFHFSGDPRAIAPMRAVLNAFYAQHAGGQDTLRILDILQKISPLPAQATSPHYPDSEFGLALRQTAALIKAEVGLEAAAIDLGGWDTHFTQAALLSRLIKDLSEGLAAFHADMADQEQTKFAMDRLTVVVLSEFGRRAAENGSPLAAGTDHGHGGIMMVLGGHVQGGKVFGNWPGLNQEQLVGPGDLAVTTDYRDVLAEIVKKRLHNPALDDVFPNFNAQDRGIMT